MKPLDDVSWLGLFLLTRVALGAYLVCAAGMCAGLPLLFYSQTHSRLAFAAALVWCLPVSYVGFMQLLFTSHRLLGLALEDPK
jgi:hypothetical protein